MLIRKLGYLMAALLLVTGLLIVGCEGDEGPQGPIGFVGDEGDPGADKSAPSPADRVFGLLVTNGSETDYNGSAALTFTTNPGTSGGVLAIKLDTPPIINGIDGGADEWGVEEGSIISLNSISGQDNGISEVEIAAAYDDQYIYLQIKWTETSTGDFVISADTTSGVWQYCYDEESWSRSWAEDQLYLVWEIGEVTGWDSEGLNAVFDGTQFQTSVEGEKADIWVWQSTQTYYSDYLVDMIVLSSLEGGLQLDVGSELVMENGDETMPTYMRSEARGLGTSYPLWVFESVPFDSEVLWWNEAKIPGYVYLMPSGSVVDVTAVAMFNSGEWIVELRRLRNTGNADDTVF